MYAQESDDSDEDEDDIEPKRIVALDAGLLAQQEKLPFLVDDRFCQNVVLHMDGQNPSAAFGTDCLLIAMFEAGQTDQRETAAAFVQLIEWRYRFLLLPVTVLEAIALEFAEHDLRKVARYVHDSMRDMGLFGGKEATDPPMPIAFRYYQDWLQIIAEFVAQLWLSNRFDHEQAVRLTSWAMTEFVPTVPTVLQQGVGRIANFSAFTVLHCVMLKLCATSDYSMANEAMRLIAKGLGLDDADFMRVASDIINSYGHIDAN